MMLMMMMIVNVMLMKKLLKARLTDGCWSPTKISLFFTTRTDGFVEVRKKRFWPSLKMIFSDLGFPAQPTAANTHNQSGWPSNTSIFIIILKITIVFHEDDRS